MHCRNCGNEVNEKAVACPKCGVNPRSEKNFCPDCGTETKTNQVVCIKCGVSLADKSFSIDTSSLQNIDVSKLLKNPALIASAVALLSCFFNWITYSSKGFSLFGLASNPMLEQDSILISFLVYLFPLCLAGIIASNFVPQIEKYKKILSIGSIVLVLYIALGLFLVINKASMLSLGLGFYIGVIATLASAYFSGLISNKSVSVNTGSLQNINVGGLLKNKIVLGIAAVAIIGFGIYFFAFGNSFDSDVKRYAEISCEMQKFQRTAITAMTDPNAITELQELSVKYTTEIQEIESRHLNEKLKFSQAVRQEMENCK